MTRHGMHPNSIANLKKGGAKTRFQPGQSGNPGGKPKSHYDVVKAARKAGQEAMRTVIKVMNNEKTAPGLRVRCAELIMNRAYGKPEIPIDVGLTDKRSDSELHLAALIVVNQEAESERLSGLTNGTEVSEKPSYLIDTLADEVKDITPK